MDDTFYGGRKALLDRERWKQSDEARSPLRKMLFPRVKTQRFSPSWIPLGFRHTPDEAAYDPKNNKFVLSVRKAQRMLQLGMTGSGKTVGLRRLGDFYHHAGYAVVYLSDIKDEMKSSLLPASDAMALLLDADDLPQPMNMRVYRPVFFTQFLRERIPADNHPLSIAYSTLTFKELLLALGFDGDKFRNQQNELTQIWQRAQSLKELQQLVKEKVSSRQLRESIDRALNALITVNAFSGESEGDILSDLRGGQAVVLNVRGHDGLSEGTASLPQIYLSIVMRLIVEARERYKDGVGRMEERLPRDVVLVIDEAPRFLRPGTYAYDELIKSVDRNRYLGVSMIFAAQTKDRVPDALINQTRYVFFPYNIPSTTAWQILQMGHFYQWHPNEKKIIIDRLRGLRVLRDGRRHWVCIDTEKKTAEIFYAYPPLSRHLEE